MDSFFDNLLTHFYTKPSIAFTICMVGAFLFGLLVNSLINISKKRRLRAEIKAKDAELQAKEPEITALLEQVKQRTAELEVENREKLNMMDQVRVLEEEKKRIYTEVYNLNTEIEQLRATNQNYINEIGELNERILALQSQPNPVVSAPTSAETSETTAEATVNDGVDVYDESSELDGEALTRLSLVEDRLSLLAAENQRLRDAIAQIESKEDARPTEASTPVMTVDLADRGGVVEELKIAPDKNVLNERILVEDRPRDPLSQINGIGPFLEQKLNEVGIYTYADLAQLDRSRVPEIETRIGWLPGRIEQDDWIGQAQRLMNMKSEQPEAFEKAVAAPSVSDDLKKIEGIGPKIAQILNDSNIHSWAQLATTDPDELREILAAAGDRYRMHVPDTWPAQARLAADGQWDELKAYQEDLKGGRETKD